MGACLGTNIDAHAADEAPQEQESYLSSLACSLAPSLVEKHFVQTAVQALARPPRRAYVRDALGPSRTGREGLIVTREDVVLTNRRGLRIHASFWSTAKTWAKTGATYLEPRPAIVYIHGAGSSRAEAADASSFFISVGTCGCLSPSMNSMTPVSYCSYPVQYSTVV